MCVSTGQVVAINQQHKPAQLGVGDVGVRRDNVCVVLCVRKHRGKPLSFWRVHVRPARCMRMYGDTTFRSRISRPNKATRTSGKTTGAGVRLPLKSPSGSSADAHAHKPVVWELDLGGVHAPELPQCAAPGLARGRGGGEDALPVQGGPDRVDGRIVAGESRGESRFRRVEELDLSSVRARQELLPVPWI